MKILPSCGILANIILRIFFPNAFYNTYSTRIFLWGEGKWKNVNTRDKGIGDVSYTWQNALYNDHCSRDFRRKNRRTVGGCAHMYTYIFPRIFFSARENRAINKINFIQIACIHTYFQAAKIAPRASNLFKNRHHDSLMCSPIVCDENYIIA